MRLRWKGAASLLLLSALAGAQDVPSLQRTGPSLPVTESVAALRARLGGPGGLFAAAQLALRGEEGFAALAGVRRDVDPLRRLDVAYGLGLLDSWTARLELARMLGDDDPRVSGEARHGFLVAGPRAIPALEFAARHVPEGDGAVGLLLHYGRGDVVPGLATSPGAGGRAAALAAYEGPGLVQVALGALADRRPEVRFVATRRIVFAPKTPERAAALGRIARLTDPELRLTLVRAMNEDPGKVLDPAYERAVRYGPPYRRREFVRMLQGALYDPDRLLDAAQILARFAVDPAPSVGDAAVEALYLFVADRLQTGFDNAGETFGREEAVWRRLPPASVALIRRGVGARLQGPRAFMAAVALARVGDRRAYPTLARTALLRTDEARTAILALGVLGGRRATPRLLELARRSVFEAYEALGHLRDPASIAPLVAMLPQIDSVNGTNAAWALAAMGDRRATPGLLAAAREDYGTSYYPQLGMLGGPGVREFFLDRLVNGPEDRLQYVVLGLGEIRDPTLAAELRHLAPTLPLVRAGRAREAIETIAYRSRRQREAPARRPWWPNSGRG